MRSAKPFIARLNTMNKLFDQKQYDADNLTVTDIKQLLDVVSSHLSPERLSADGERSRSEMMRLHRSLEATANDLINLAAKRHGVALE
jgi:hypothetical protein